jgi:mannosyltransferase OCH1-like enzyme
VAIWDGEEQKQFVPVPAPEAVALVIPKTFHLIWNHSPLPDVYLEHGKKLQALHPDWTLEYWDDDRAHAFMDLQRGGELDDLVIMLEHAYGNVKDKRQVSDLLRLGLVYLYGGVYLDFDYTPLKNFEPLLRGATCTLTCPSPRNIANGFIAAGPADVFVDFCLSQLMHEYFSRPGEAATHRTGPRFITQMYKDFVEHYDMVPARLLPQKYFYPYTYNRTDREGEDFPEAYAVHRWASLKGDVWEPQ